MRTVIVIPARFASSRLPGKPLLRATGKYLIEHVYDQASRARRAERVIVATDDRRIESAVKSFGGEVVMTRGDVASGTDRVAEAARALPADLIVNLQGDEPLIEPDALDYVTDLLGRHQSAAMATLATPLRSLEQYHNPNCVKVVVGDLGQALYFSRSPIPFVRDGGPDLGRQPFQFFQHVGLYAYRRDFLLRLAQTPPSPLEQLEKLEQLRVLGLGQRIQVGVTAHAAAGVDTPEDYERFVQAWRKQTLELPTRRAA
jgi:3-deoxy-manno-octulosonate cytidylyltransferase (CMP-KDO synthetase)